MFRVLFLVALFSVVGCYQAHPVASCEDACQRVVGKLHCEIHPQASTDWEAYCAAACAVQGWSVEKRECVAALEYCADAELCL